MRGIRGAITIKNDTEAEIFAAVRWMVTEMCRHNGVKPDDIGACILSATEDITQTSQFQNELKHCFI